MKLKTPPDNAMLPKYIHSPATPKGRGKAKVTIHIPEAAAENLKRQKINRIYDILNPETSQ